jgi:hypothetical protein
VICRIGTASCIPIRFPSAVSPEQDSCQDPIISKNTELADTQGLFPRLRSVVLASGEIFQPENARYCLKTRTLNSLHTPQGAALVAVLALKQQIILQLHALNRASIRLKTPMCQGLVHLSLFLI